MKCTGCGCTEFHACLGVCYWVRPGLCSACWDSQVEALACAAAPLLQSRAARASKTGTIAGLPCEIEKDGTEVVVRDHIGLLIFSVSFDGY